jgi:hypothetical protein
VNVELNVNGVPVQLQDYDFLESYFLSHEPGVYTLRELFGPLWTSFNRPQYYGRWFKQLVDLGIVDHIHIGGKRSNGSMEYVIW